MDPASIPGGDPEGAAPRSERAPLPEWVSLLALALVFSGWFLMDTLRTSIGAITLEFHFFDMAAIIAEPARLFTGVGSNLAYLTLPFGLLCALVLASTLAPYLSGSRTARLARGAPLLLMLVCGAILYSQTSQDTFVAAQSAGDVSNALINLANVMARHTIGVVARHVGVGGGAWVAAAGALYLGYTAVKR